MCCIIWLSFRQVQESNCELELLRCLMMNGIDGGTGYDTLTVNALNQSCTVVNAHGQVIYQQGTGGSVITVRNVECLKVLSAGGVVLYQSGC